MVRDVIDNKSKIILAHASSGYEHSLREILQSPIVMKKIRDTKATKEVRALNDFYTMLSHDASRACYDPKHVIDNKSKIILAHASSGYEHSLREILQSPIVMKKIRDTKAAKEVRPLNDFYTMLSHDASGACYDPKHVESANEERAIQTLLIMDELFRNSDFKTRQKYVDLVVSVKASGGVVYIVRQCTPLDSN